MASPVEHSEIDLYIYGLENLRIKTPSPNTFFLSPWWRTLGVEGVGESAKRQSFFLLLLPMLRPCLDGLTKVNKPT